MKNSIENYSRFLDDDNWEKKYNTLIGLVSWFNDVDLDCFRFSVLNTKTVYIILETCFLSNTEKLSLYAMCIVMLFVDFQIKHFRRMSKFMLEEMPNRTESLK